MHPERRSFSWYMMLVVLIVLLPPTLQGCNKIRRTLGMEEKIEYIKEQHLAPCQQPHQGYPMRDCAGARSGYNTQPTGPQQDF